LRTPRLLIDRAHGIAVAANIESVQGMLAARAQASGLSTPGDSF